MENKKKSKHTVALVILILVLILAGAVVVINPFDKLLAARQAKLATPVEEVVSKASVKVTSITAGPLDQVISGNGNVIDPNSLDVYPEVVGTLTELPVSVGQKVEKDQVLAVIDPSRAGMVYQKSVVKAPSAGTILSLPFVKGATVSSQAPIARLGLLGDLEVVMYIAEQYIGQVGIGTHAELSFKAFPDKTFTGTVNYLSPVLNAASRTLEIHLAINDSEGLVKSGMFPSVTLYTKHMDNVITVPASAVLYEGLQSYVYLATDSDQAQKQFVTLGIQVGNLIEVTQGLSVQDRLVVEGQSLLTDGADLKVIE